MKKISRIIFVVVLYTSILHAQNGIGTPTPQATFHVNGSLQITEDIQLGGTTNTKGSSGLAGQVLKSNGPGLAPSWEALAGVPNATGSVIVVNGQFIVAQEIIVQMTADFLGKAAVTGNPPAFLGNLNDEIIDNENTYKGNTTSNSFKVVADGVYQIMMNVQIQSINASTPVIGVWDDTAGKWIARANDHFVAPDTKSQTYTLITSVPMVASKTYSFRTSNNKDYTVKQLSSGSSGSGPVTQVSLKRLK
ncbi:hypothetical protein B4N84_01425 [Flavobacterium sp. IR1]|nr:hypothetical protein B4N84_01425 [Flavobacterium sp. IR1]